VDDVAAMMEREKIDVLAVSEVWRHREEKEDVEAEWSKRGYNIITNLREEWNERRRGGVALISKKHMKMKKAKESKNEGLVWGQLQLHNNILFFASVYLLPRESSSTRSKKWAKGIDDTLEEIEHDIIELGGRGVVLMGGDWNARIMKEFQNFQQEDEEEEELKVERKFREELKRERKVQTNTTGLKLWDMCNANNIIIANGTQIGDKRRVAQPTTDKGTIIDYILYPLSKQKYMTEVEECDARRTGVKSDHFLLSVGVDVKEWNEKKENNNSSNSNSNNSNHSNNNNHNNKSWKFNSDKVKEWEKRCEEVLKEWKVKESVEQSWASLRQSILSSAEVVFAHKPARVGQKKEEDVQSRVLVNKPSAKLKEMIERRRQFQREGRGEESKKLYEKIKKQSRKEKRREVKEKLNVIEETKKVDTKKFWELLFKETRVKNKASKKAAPKEMKDEKGNKTSDEKEKKEIWRRAYERLGNEEGGGKYSAENNERVEREVKRIWEEEEKEQTQQNDEHIEENQQQNNLNNSALNRDIELSEVVDVIRSLCNGKASGSDSISGELLKYGGISLWTAVWRLCQQAFEAATIPEEWASGVISPIFKDGDPADPLNYRGITLLSVVGKVYASVLNRRLMSWCELNDVIADEQCGFRPERGTRDQLFALSETIKMRRRTNKRTFCCFVDLKKAYDRVFRAGLWEKLHKSGVRGRMWRALVKAYDVVRSAVRVDGQCTDYFDVNIGLRQGCVLSPILFDIFVNDLVAELKEKGWGVEVGMSRLSILLFADDIVLVADSAQELQQMLDLVTDFCSRWRCDCNTKKTEVVVYGKGVSKAEMEKMRFHMGAAELRVVVSYKYLGLDLMRTGSMAKMKERLLAKARAKVASALGIANTHGLLTVSYGVQLWHTLIRPTLEYGAEIWGHQKWEQAEALQRFAGKRILRCSKLTTDEAVLGELGWWTLKARRDMLRLRYWAMLVNMSLVRITKCVFVESKREFDSTWRVYFEQAEEKKKAIKEGKEDESVKEALAVLSKKITQAKRENWCAATFELLQKYGLVDHWDEAWIDPTWHTRVRKAIHAKEEEEWKLRMTEKQKLRLFSKLKVKLRPEPYLLKSKGEQAVYDMFKIRSGTHCLTVETDRWVGVKHEERVCPLCAQGVEDEEHFLLHCSYFVNERYEFFERFKQKFGIDFAAVTPEGRLNILLGNIPEYRRFRHVCQRFVHRIYMKRQALHQLLSARGP